MLRSLLRFSLMLGALTGAQAQDNAQAFKAGPDGSAVHAASGFVCPARIGTFERDAVGPRDPERDADYCAYSALSGVYGTIVVMPLPAMFDPKAVLAGEFAVQEGTGGVVIDEAIQSARPAGIPVYTRIYETARLESLHYRTQFASAAIGGWVIEVIVEYASPRDEQSEAMFLSAVYSAALRDIGSGN